MSNNGLSEQHLDIIKRVLAPYAERIETVGLFGSRATGKYRDNSGIDMVLYGGLTEFLGPALGISTTKNASCSHSDISHQTKWRDHTMKN